VHGWDEARTAFVYQIDLQLSAATSSQQAELADFEHESSFRGIRW